jgi:heat shock protein HtpX
MTIPATSEAPAPLAPVSTDFLAAQRKNRIATIQLLVVLTLIAAVFGYVLGWVVEAYGVTDALPAPTVADIFFLSEFGLIAAAGLAVLSCVWSGVSLASADRMVLRSAGGRELNPGSEPVLENVVEEMAIASGLPKPAIYLIDTDVPNAFATGLRPDRASIAVTSGLLKALDRNELQGVIGHEMAHIANADTRYLSVVAATVGLISMIAYGILRTLRHVRPPRRSRGKGALVIVILVLILVAISALAPLAARLVQFAVSRQREYLADATSVQFTRHPQGLASALRKITDAAQPFSGATTSNQHMFIVNPLHRASPGERPWFATHPDTESRVARLMDMQK